MLRLKSVILLLSVMLLLSSCTPRSYELLFHPLIENDHNYLFDGREYSVFIDKVQIDKLPDPIRCYLVKCGVMNVERITECFFEYKGSITKCNKKMDIKKHYSMKDHASGLIPMYEVNGQSFPVSMSSKLNYSASVEARFGWKNLLADINAGKEATNSLCVLKYLAQMVWYPTSFVNSNIMLIPVIEDSVIATNSIHVRLGEGALSASGNLFFDTESCIPLRFVGDIHNEVSSRFSITRFDVEYSNFDSVQGLRIPYKCVAKIIDDEQGEIIVVMNLKTIKPIVSSTLTDKKFSDRQERLKMRVYKWEKSWLKQVIDHLLRPHKKTT